ncbi:NTP transferase domain-containing protein [Leptospira sp. 201903070]|uniref:NTP transferase domain-containing protein n=1 Tax=Leptospira ainlahdjerensis TaxID=2810033 RepID=A0ABS2UDK6_9LEPT|nr:sugar phosphate nucleotidyltransferase [Leptospira ainlahdjerensis]MBM9577322.1 NTP transferase domain-containing protein [Leptospira ainlahdjerensis]
MNTPMFILAGGFGTRLKSVVSELPKPLAPVEGKPFLQYLLERWMDQGLSCFVLLLHHKADHIIRFIQEYQNELPKSVDFFFVTESVPLGTGGSVANAVKELRFEGDFFVSNADTWLGPKSVSKMADSIGYGIGITEVKDASRYGLVEVNDKKIVQFHEKTGSIGGGWINAGVYKLGSSLFKAWDRKPFSMEVDLFPKIILDHGLNAIELESEFIDIGIPEDYSRFQKWIQSGKSFPL